MDDMDDAGMQEFFMGLEDTQEESEDAKQNDLGAGITREELATCCRVLKILGEEQKVFSSPQFKELRICLQPLLDIEGKKRFAGGSKEEIAARREQQQTVNRIQQQAKSHDKRFINNTLLRAGRIARLEALKAASDPDNQLSLLVPDGVPLLEDGRPPAILPSAASELPPSASELPPPAPASATEAGVAVRGGGGGEGGGEQEGEDVTLNYHRACYICKRRFMTLHFFYDQLCPTCAALNYKKRLQAANMKGKIAIVTGARVKIGFRVCLKLLRCGATVIATTRFPMDGLKRMQEEKDFADFEARLHVVGLDLRDVVAVEMFTEVVKREFGKVDILVNNACQTVRRPTAYYAHQVRKEADIAAASPPTV